MGCRGKLLLRQNGKDLCLAKRGYCLNYDYVISKTANQTIGPAFRELNTLRFNLGSLLTEFYAYTFYRVTHIYKIPITCMFYIISLDMPFV